MVFPKAPTSALGEENASDCHKGDPVDEARPTGRLSFVEPTFTCSGRCPKSHQEQLSLVLFTFFGLPRLCRRVLAKVMCHLGMVYSGERRGSDSKHNKGLTSHNVFFKN